MRVRPATSADIPFLVEAICEAEKGGSDRLSYCRVFDFTEAEFSGVLASMLGEDLDGQELAISPFLIAIDDEAPLGAVAAWIEAADGVSSTILKANLLLHSIDRDRMRTAQRHFAKLAELTLPREPGTIQIESVYVRADQRGRGIAAALIDAQIARLAANASCPKAQVILTADNAAARAAYAKLGFNVAAERHSDEQSLLALVPSLGKLLMEKPIILGAN